MGASLATDPEHGTPQPGAVGAQHGVNFAVFATHALAVEVVLPHATGMGTDSGTRTGTDVGATTTVPLQPVGQDRWCAFVPGLGAGQPYQLQVRRADPATAAPPERLPCASHPHSAHSAPGTASAPGALGHAAGAPPCAADGRVLRLLDPWAHGLLGDTAQLAHRTPLSPCAPPLPHAVVVDLDAERALGAQALHAAPRPTVAPARTVLCEVHVKAHTRLHPGVPEALRGTYAGLASPAVLAHWRALGITTVCLLPVHQHLSERHLLDKNLTNHWGYNPLNVFTPDPRFAACTGGQAPSNAEQATAVRAEFRAMVQALHRAGLEVVLDVVFNHSAEGDANGPLLSWRGLAPTDWYAHTPQGQPHNFSGCGNSLNLGHPVALHWVMDSLRWWVQAFGVDGFRFDLATSLGRHGPDQRYSPQAPLLAAMAQDPVLARARLIAEPWDLGPGGYQLGQFGPGWQEWNDRFRDTARAFWLGHPCTPGAMACVLLASSDRFQPPHKRPLDSINLITAHDGYTLADLTAHTQRHNLANGEDNRDGHGHNLSANAGTEGPSTDPATLAQRARWQRALLATLLLAQGTPQLLAGDELGHSQHGNNNAYCQDNPTTWLAWPDASAHLMPPAGDAVSPLARWVSGLTALRARHPGLRHPQWFTGQPMAQWQPSLGAHSTLNDHGCPLHSPPPNTDIQRVHCLHACPVLCPWAAAQLEPDVTWRCLDGGPMTPQRWNNPQQRHLACVITVGEPGQRPTERLLLAFNAGADAHPLTLPPGAWHSVLDSATDGLATDHHLSPPISGHTELAGCTVRLLVQPLQAPGPDAHT